MRHTVAKSRKAKPAVSADERMPDAPFAEGAHDMLSADLRHRMISETAYHLYTQRGYRDGYDLDDWLEAEARIDHLLLEPPQGDAQAENA